jgi:hypothetical protein
VFLVGDELSDIGTNRLDILRMLDIDNRIITQDKGKKTEVCTNGF